MRTHTVIDSAVGPLTVVAEDGAIAGLYMDLQRHRPGDDELGDSDPRGRQSEPFKAAIANMGQEYAYLNAGEFAKFWDADAKRSDAAVQAIGRVQG